VTGSLAPNSSRRRDLGADLLGPTEARDRAAERPLARHAARLHARGGVEEVFAHLVEDRGAAGAAGLHPLASRAR
jgi:hypothetical protein